jgi:hypothetical protein
MLAIGLTDYDFFRLNNELNTDFFLLDGELK